MWLSLNPYLDIKEITCIQSLEHDFNKWSLWNKISSIAMYVRNYEGIVFYRDYVLTVIFVISHPFIASRKKLVFHEFYLLETHLSDNLFVIKRLKEHIKLLIRNCLFKLLFHTFDKVIVHSTEKVRYLSKHYSEPVSKFEFLHYYRYDAGDDSIKSHPLSADPLFCSAGNNRDFFTFAQALAATHNRGRIVGARGNLQFSTPRLEVYSTVPRNEYDRLIAESDVIVITLFRDRYQRSLGQILLMKAFALKIPCIVARNSYIMDYCDDESVVFYNPEDVGSLCSAIKAIQKMPYSEIMAMTDRAYHSLKDKTRTNYLKHIEEILNSI